MNRLIETFGSLDAALAAGAPALARAGLPAEAVHALRHPDEPSDRRSGGARRPVAERELSDDEPVRGIDWWDAWACARYYGGRLPTEAGWEKLARWSGRTAPAPDLMLEFRKIFGEQWPATAHWPDEPLTLSPFDVSPSTPDLAQARTWLDRLEVAGFDGVVAKRAGSPYLPGSREAVQKVKGEKTADCVVMGVTWSEKGTGIASLFLGLYDGGKLIPVGSAPAAGNIEASSQYESAVSALSTPATANPTHTDAPASSVAAPSST